jgi:anti-sigma factor RsiW
MSKSKRTNVQKEHHAVEGMLSAYLDGMLSSKEQAQVEHHLQRCPHCAQNLASLRHTVSLLQAMPAVPVPRAFTIRVPAEAQRMRPAWGLGLLRAATALAAVMLIVVLAGDLWLGGLQLGGAQPVLTVEQPLALRQEVQVTRVVEAEVAVEEAEGEAATVVAMAPKEMGTPAPQPRASEAAITESAVATEPLGIGGEAGGGSPPSPETEEPLAAVAAPTETLSDLEEPMPDKPAPPAEAEVAGEPGTEEAAAALAQAPEGDVERTTDLRTESLREEPPIDWLTVVEIGLAVLVVLMGSATLLVSLMRRRWR